MAPGRVLTRRQLNRALLARQLLLERATTGVPRALERLAGLQAQYAPSMYIGLWSRREGVAREDVTRLLERRSIVQATLMRMTIHLVARRDFWPFAVATADARRRSWLASRRGMGVADMEAAAELVRERLAGGPLHRRELDELVGRERALGVGQWVHLVRVPPSGTWEHRRADLFGAAEHWVGPPAVTAQEGVEHLVRRYLGGFGPAGRRDIELFSGLSRQELAPALERLPLRCFRSEDGEQLLDLPRAPLPHPETPAPVRYLPTWDATLLVHARRTGILPEEHRPRIFSTRNPQSVPTFLVDGVVAGTWRHDGGRIVAEPFGRLDRAARAALRDEADRLAAFHA